MNPQPRSDTSPSHPDEPRSSLSALADGQSGELARACSLWRDDAGARQAWHTYHLIGDVLRSDELASTPARDAAFLAGLRTRLAAEPVVLAPQPPAPEAPRRRQVWLVPAAMAAGFVAVAGVLIVARMGGTAGESSRAVMAESGGVVGPGVRLVNSPALQPQVLTGNAAFIRDPRLDQYLRAHQVARGGAVIPAAQGLMRPVEAVVQASSPQR
jgi:sigma-E factor negative regulatory protein RseA